MILALTALTSVIFGGAVGFAMHQPTMFGFSGTLLLTACVGLITLGEPTHYSLAIMLFVVSLTVFRFSTNYHHSITKELLLAEANARLVSDLTQTNKALAASNEARLRFLASASHDLRQPMHALGLFAAALDGSVSGDHDRRTYERMIASIRSMESLIEELLGISRLEAGVVVPQLRPTELQLVFNELNALFAGDVLNRPVALTFVATRVIVHTDAALLHRLLANLVSNALRYTERGGVLIGCRRRGNEVRVDVIDSGCGIDKEFWDQIFLEFVQLHNPERDRSKGLGLGLAIVKRLAAILGTDVTLESVPGRGSRFSFTLPLAGVSAPRAANPVGKRDDAHSLRGLLILAIDDERDVRDALTLLLSQWGAFVVTAGSGAEALQKIDQEPRAAPHSQLEVGRRLCIDYAARRLASTR